MQDFVRIVATKKPKPEKQEMESAIQLLGAVLHTRQLKHLIAVPKITQLMSIINLWKSVPSMTQRDTLLKNNWNIFPLTRC